MTPLEINRLCAYSGEPPPAWPWDRRWWKPRKPYRDLTRAAALSVAEMARRMRKACDIAEDAIGSATDREAQSK